MSRSGDGRLVYSTEAGRMCPSCSRPQRDCQCRATPGAAKVPARVVAKLRMEKAGRGGKTVTVVFDLPRNTAFLKELCQDLKRLCGTGGAVVENTVELQGDLRDRVRDHLKKKGFAVKG